MDRFRYISVVAVCFCMSCIALAETPENSPRYFPNSLGLILGADMYPSFMVGLSYQRWFGRIGLSLAAGGFDDSVSNPQAVPLGDLIWSADLTAALQFAFWDIRWTEASFTSMYAYALSGGFFRCRYSEVVWLEPVVESYVPLAAGLGAETTLPGRLSLPVELGAEWRPGTDRFALIWRAGARIRF